MDTAPKGQKLIETIYNGAAEVSSAILTAVSTTIISFIPVFTMEAAEGKLFRPLAFTKTFALIAALITALFILPTLAHWVFGFKVSKNKKGVIFNALLIVFGIISIIWISTWAGVTLIAISLAWFVQEYSPIQNWFAKNLIIIVSVISITWLLADYWMPLGAGKSGLLNFIFVALIITTILGLFALLERYYPIVLAWCLAHKKTFLSIPVFIILLASVIWMGFNSVFGFVSSGFNKANVPIEKTAIWSSLSESFPGIGKEFMPSLDEGSFLLMPTSMPHAGIEQNKRVVQQLDMILANIPEVELAVGKMGRTESALDPAPISMYENIINYKSEYALNEQGHRQRFKTDNDNLFILTNGDTISNADAITQGITREDLISDESGQYFRNWRDHIQSSDDIWSEIISTINLPGVTSAPKLQPIETRLVMLQTGMRAPMGIKVFGPDLPTIEKFGMELEQVLKEVPSVKTEAVFADRIVGKPYIHLNINREAISRYGLSVNDVQQTIETAIGGMQITTTVEGRERFPVRVRYPRELRDDPTMLSKIVVSTANGAHIPLGDLVDVEYVRGPQMIKSENTFLVGYVLLDKKDGYAEVDVVEAAQKLINERIDEGSIVVPKGVSYKFSGSYENQIRAEKRLAIVVPLVLVIIFLILYFQFKSISTSLMIFGGIAMAFSGAFLMLWFYSKGWFLNFSFFDTDLRDLFQIKTINLSVAVWVGFIALFGIATDDGVLIGTYLDYSFKNNKPKTVNEIRAAVSEAGLKRIKPAIMTTATTIIALLPVLTSTGRGADIMIPMAIPAFGGMIVASITYFITPVLYSMREEYQLKKKSNDK